MVSKQVQRTRDRAYSRVHYYVRLGQLPNVKTQPCFHCGEPAAGYDHFRGYERENELLILPVCKSCHSRLELVRRGRQACWTKYPIGPRMKHRDFYSYNRLRG